MHWVRGVCASRDWVENSCRVRIGTGHQTAASARYSHTRIFACRSNILPQCRCGSMDMHATVWRR